MNLRNVYDTTRLRLTEKIVIIINGKGGAGKDTVCEIAARYFNVEIISAITPIKDIARQHGWNGEKDNKARRFLSDLKRAFIKYNDLPNRYLEAEYDKFEQSDNDILFVHIRERDQIDDFIRRVRIKCVTLLVRSSKVEKLGEFGNSSDDDVENYHYDYYYTNGRPMSELIPTFMDFLVDSLLTEEGITYEKKPENIPWRSNVHLC